MEAYLALRQQLKQSIRAQMQRDNNCGSATDPSTAGDSHSNYGCFFGPSETVLTGNAVKQISNLWSKFNTGRQIDFKKTSAKPTATRKRKVQRFKDSRESYSPPQERDLILQKPIKLIVKLGGSVITKNPTKSTEKGDQKSNPSRANKESKEQQQRPEQKKKRRPVEKREKVEGEDNDAINLIREMFGYDPTIFNDDDEEDLKMEASFADIQKEERRSAKIASKEDREELRKQEAADQRRKRRKLIISDDEVDEL